MHVMTYRMGRPLPKQSRPTLHLRPARTIETPMHPTVSFPRRALLALAWLAATCGTPALAQERSIVMASTTSTEQSGLFAHLLPAFKRASGIDVRVVALGTGQALDTARRGDADIVFVHDQAAEEKFVAEGFGIKRTPVMYNDFILVGPKADPAATQGADVAAALAKLAAGPSVFISRGDKSGTHAAELRYWKTANVDIATAKPAGFAATTSTPAAFQ